MDVSDIGVGTIVAGIVVAAILLWVFLGTLIGAFAGWILSLTPFGSWIEEGFASIGIDARGKLVAIGALLGFISGFFRHTIKEKD